MAVLKTIRKTRSLYQWLPSKMDTNKWSINIA